MDAFILAFYSLNMFSSFGVKKATDVQIINSAILYFILDAHAHGRQNIMIGRPTLARMLPDREMQSAEGNW